MARQLPDRSGFALGARSVLLLLRQPWLLGPAIVATLAWAALLGWTSWSSGHFDGESGLVLLAVSPLVGFGTAMLTALPAFLLVRAIRGDACCFELAEGESVVFECRASHLAGGESRGGRLYVTSRRLAFVPHALNVQRAPFDLAMDRIERVGWARLIAPSGLVASKVVVVETASGTETYVAPQAERVATLLESLHRSGEEARAHDCAHLLNAAGLA